MHSYDLGTMSAILDMSNIFMDGSASHSYLQKPVRPPAGPLPEVPGSSPLELSVNHATSTLCDKEIKYKPGLDRIRTGVQTDILRSEALG